MQFFHKRVALEDGVSLLDYYRPGAVPQEVLEQAKRYKNDEEERTNKVFGIKETE